MFLSPCLILFKSSFTYSQVLLSSHAEQKHLSSQLLRHFFFLSFFRFLCSVLRRYICMWMYFPEEQVTCALPAKLKESYTTDIHADEAHHGIRNNFKNSFKISAKSWREKGFVICLGLFSYDISFSFYNNMECHGKHFWIQLSFHSMIGP